MKEPVFNILVNPKLQKFKMRDKVADLLSEKITSLVDTAEKVDNKIEIEESTATSLKGVITEL